MAISDQKRLYGQLVVDFANAGSTDEAGLRYFENVQQAFGFPPQFADKAKANFPTINGFRSSLTGPEMQCFNLILEKRVIESQIDSAMNGNSFEYNVHLKSMNIREFLYPQIQDGLLTGYAEIKDKEISIKDVEERIRKYHTDTGDESTPINVSKMLPKLRKIGKKIHALKGISEARYKEISEFVPHYRVLNSEHWIIESIQKKLIFLLNEIIKKSLLSDSGILKEVLSRYNAIPKSKAYLSGEGTIKEDPPFGEASFLNHKDFPLHATEIYTGPISYCLIKFISDINNIKYFKKCKYCNGFIIAEPINRQFCVKPKECKKIYYNKYIARRMKEEYRNPSSKLFKVDYLR